MTVPNEDKAFVAGICLGGIIFLAFGSTIVGAINSQWRDEAIKHKAARYNESSGRFEWIEPDVKPEDKP